MNDELTLVDTNVLVHAYAVADQRKHEQARAWVTRIWEGEKAATTLQNLCEFFFVVTRKVAKPLSHAQAQAVLSGILAASQWVVLDRNPKTVLKALDLVKLHRTSIWDALIAASMLEHNVSKILTENERDFRTDFQHNGDQSIQAAVQRKLTKPGQQTHAPARLLQRAPPA